MKTVKIDYTPHPKQKDFHDNESKYRAFVGGVGSGKTLAGTQEALRQAMTQAGSLGLIVAPTYPMLRDSTRRTFFETCPRELIANFQKTDNHVQFNNGSEIIFRSADEPDKLRGTNLAWFYIDEAAYVDGKTWEILIGRLKQKGKKHLAWITTTPKGYNWVYDTFAKSEGIISCSSRDNPHLPFDFIIDLEKTYTGAFAKQEIDGLFVGFEGLVYEFARNVNVCDESKQCSRVIAGVDWGYTNPTAIVVIGIDNDDNYHVLDEFYQRRVLIDDVVAAAQKLKAEYNIEMFYCDPSEPANIQVFRQNGLSAKAMKSGVLEKIRVLSSKLANMRIHRKCVNTIMEFENYRYAESRDGKPVQENPIKLFDHALDALGGAIYTHNIQTGSVKIVGDVDGIFENTTGFNY